MLLRTDVEGYLALVISAILSDSWQLLIQMRTGDIVVPKNLARRSIGVIATCFVMLAMTGEGFDPATLYSHQWTLGLFGGLIAICLYLYLQYQVNAGVVLKFVAMPFGFYVSLIFLVDLVDGGSAAISLALVPAVVGGALSAFFLDRELPASFSPKWDKRFDYLFFVGCILVIPFVVSKDPIWILLHPFGWIITCGSAIAIFCFFLVERPLEERLLEATLFGFLIVTAIAILAYLSLVVADVSSAEIQRAQRGVATLLCSSIYSMVFYFFALLYCLSVGKTEKVVRSNWHLAEGFVFIVFIFFAPASLLEGM
jgi:hypothetical protein